MKCIAVSLVALLLTASAVVPAQPPSAAPPPASVPASAPLRSAVLAGDTLYVSGQLDLDAHGNPGKTPEEAARIALDNVGKVLTTNGFTFDDLVLVQVFAADLASFDAFNKVYRTYFKGPMPARAFIGAGSLLRGGHYEVLGIAVKGHK
jgi:2-iminobutanoate/2-iminopropanoate deaminase